MNQVTRFIITDLGHKNTLSGQSHLIGSTSSQKWNLSFMKTKIFLLFMFILLMSQAIHAQDQDTLDKSNLKESYKGFTFKMEKKSTYEVRDPIGNVMQIQTVKDGYIFAIINIEINKEAKIKFDISKLSHVELFDAVGDKCLVKSQTVTGKGTKGNVQIVSIVREGTKLKKLQLEDMSFDIENIN
jgi:hypothetical protein